MCMSYALGECGRMFLATVYSEKCPPFTLQTMGGCVPWSSQNTACPHPRTLQRTLEQNETVSKENVNVMLLYIPFKKYRIKSQVLLECK